MEEENEISLSPIGRLMSDDTETVEEQSAYVSGFERNQPEDSPEPASSLAERRRPKRERPVSSTSLDSLSDEDFFETGIREARASRERDRDRRRQPNPDPRPAVRATIPTPKRMAAPPPRRDEKINSPDSPPEDKYDTFRQRYNPGDLISAGRGGRPVRRGAPPRDSDPSSGRGFDNDGGDSPNVLRIVGVAGVFVLLIFLVFMTVSRNSINRRYAEAQERIASMETAYARTNSLEREVDSLEIQRSTLQNRVDDLEAQLEQQNNAGTQAGTTQPGTDTGTSDIDEAPPGQGNLPATHVIERGQSLTRIAVLFYGPGTATENHLRAEHIARYNNIPSLDAIQAGQTITIPPLP